MQCPKCADEQAGTFCRQCGTRLRASTSQGQPVAAEAMGAVPFQAPSPISGPVPTPSSGSVTAPAPPPQAPTHPPTVKTRPDPGAVTTHVYESTVPLAADPYGTTPTPSYRQDPQGLGSLETSGLGAPSGPVGSGREEQGLIPPSVPPPYLPADAAGGGAGESKGRGTSRALRIALIAAAVLIAAVAPAGVVYWWFVVRTPEPSTAVVDSVVVTSSATPKVSASSSGTPSDTSSEIPTPDSGGAGQPSTGGSSLPIIPSEQPSVTPQQALTDQRDADVPTLTLDGHWVAQLASKFDGVTDPRQEAPDGTHTFRLADILAEHQGFRSRFGDGIKLIGGDDMGKRSGRLVATWTTIYDPGSFADESSVASWCLSAFPRLTGNDLGDVCLPRPSSPPHN